MCSGEGAHLTSREIEVLLLAADGMPSKQIARVLDISIRTVEEHIESMLRRSGAGSRVELIARCYAAGTLLTGVWPPSWSGIRCVQIAKVSARAAATPEDKVP